MRLFFGNFVGHRVVDADLQVFEPRAIQPLDALGRQQVAVRDDPREDSVPAHARDDLVELRMQQRLAAADRHDRRAHLRQAIDPPKHFSKFHRLREIVEFVAIRAGQIASPDRNDVHQQRMPRRDQPFHHAVQFAHTRVREPQSPPHSDTQWHC